jgi:hypothetical protein
MKQIDFPIEIDGLYVERVIVTHRFKAVISDETHFWSAADCTHSKSPGYPIARVRYATIVDSGLRSRCSVTTKPGRCISRLHANEEVPVASSIGESRKRWLSSILIGLDWIRSEQSPLQSSKYVDVDNFRDRFSDMGYRVWLAL